MALHLNEKEIDELANFLLSEPIRTKLLETFEELQNGTTDVVYITPQDDNTIEIKTMEVQDEDAK